MGKYSCCDHAFTKLWRRDRETVAFVYDRSTAIQLCMLVLMALTRFKTIRTKRPEDQDMRGWDIERGQRGLKSYL